jgi:uncharacterized membrane protein
MYRKEQYMRRKQMHHPDANDAEEVVVPSVTALVGILLTGLLYLVLPPNLIIGPSWLLLVMEGVFVVPLVIDVMTAMFPQQATGGSWAPHFLDYLFLAFTAATALSPADTYPLTRPAKMLMMIEAVLSLTLVGILIARAVNILG